jgi:hypothetical protein
LLGDGGGGGGGGGKWERIRSNLQEEAWLID